MHHMSRQHQMPATFHVRDLTADECHHLIGELDVARRVALRYRYRYEGIAAGYVFLAGYVAGTGSHYMLSSGIPTTFNPSKPTFLLYDGDGAMADLVGVAYEQHSRLPPAFFAGPNDVPHRHAWCPAVSPSTVPRTPGDPGCTDSNAAGAYDWIVHVWLVPHRASPAGMFSAENPNLTTHGWDPKHPIFRVAQTG
jgi:hypothetical protein